MPRYEYRCRACGDTFELDRPMAAANDPAPCPDGHADTVKLISMTSITGLASSPAHARPSTGGCCGGACGCGS